MSCMSCMTCMRQAKKVVDDTEKAPVDHSCSHWISCDRQAAFFSIVIRFFNSDFDVFCLSCLPAMMSCATAHHYCAFRCCAGRGRGGRAESSSAASVATEDATGAGPPPTPFCPLLLAHLTCISMTLTCICHAWHAVHCITLHAFIMHDIQLFA